MLAIPRRNHFALGDVADQEDVIGLSSSGSVLLFSLPSDLLRSEGGSQDWLIHAECGSIFQR